MIVTLGHSRTAFHVPAPTRPQKLSELLSRATTMIYTHVVNSGPAGVRSPADRMLGA